MVEAPLHVQATIFRHAEKKRLVLHLLNDPNPKGLVPFRLHLFQRQKEEVVPIYGVKVSLRGKFKRIYLAPGRKNIKVKYANGYTTVEIPRLDTHLMVVAEEA